MRVRSILIAASLLLPGLLLPAAAQAPLKEFSRSERANPRLARSLAIPAFFALPDSARGPLPNKIATTDTLVDFRHPDAPTLGLRVIETARSGMAERLGNSGVFQTGDLILSFWPGWGGAGPYPNVQMGVSHVGVAYVKDGVLHNLDNPLNADYNKPSNLRSANYREVSHMHVVRPRSLTDSQRANLLAWITRLADAQTTLYGTQLDFNADYNAPKFKAGQSPEFVKAIGAMAVGRYTGPKLALYCSEFAWAVLSLRNCEPDRTASDFAGRGMPRCVAEPMQPMLATGDYMMTRGRRANAGLADGPLMVIDTMSLAPDARAKMIDTVFAQTRRDNKMSSGHREVAKQMEPKFKPLQAYYAGVYGSGAEKQTAQAIAQGFRAEIPQNYSPTSYLINTLLPSDNPNRTMDYIATIVVK